jgi:hypothetical protein
MSQLVKTKRQANFKGFKRFGAFKGLVEQKNVVFFGTSGPFFLKAHSFQKRPNSFDKGRLDFDWDFALNKYSLRAYLQSFPTT